MFSSDICGICRDSLQEPTVLPCDHVFHKACIDMWVRRVNQCPYCRKPVVLKRAIEDIYSHTLDMYDEEDVDEMTHYVDHVAIDLTSEIDYDSVVDLTSETDNDDATIDLTGLSDDETVLGEDLEFDSQLTFDMDELSTRSALFAEEMTALHATSIPREMVITERSSRREEHVPSEQSSMSEWITASRYYSLTEIHMRTFMDIVYDNTDECSTVLENFTVFQVLSEDFIRDYLVDLDLDAVAEFQQLSTDFKIEVGVEPQISDFDCIESYERFLVQRQLVRELLGL